MSDTWLELSEILSKLIENNLGDLPKFLKPGYEEEGRSPSFISLYS